MSGTGLGRAAFYCNPVLKVDKGCILFLLREGKGWLRAHLQKETATLPELQKVVNLLEWKGEKTEKSSKRRNLILRFTFFKIHRFHLIEICHTGHSATVSVLC